MLAQHLHLSAFDRRLLPVDVDVVLQYRRRQRPAVRGRLQLDLHVQQVDERGGHHRLQARVEHRPHGVRRQRCVDGGHSVVGGDDKQR